MKANFHGSHHSSWHKPPVGWYKVNTDGSFKSSSSGSSCGGIIRNDAGRHMKVFFFFVESILVMLYGLKCLLFFRGLNLQRIWILSKSFLKSIHKCFLIWFSKVSLQPLLFSLSIKRRFLFFVIQVGSRLSLWSLGKQICVLIC